MNNLKDKLRKKKITVGSWITFSDPAVAEIMARVGFDWLVVDMEHSGLSLGNAQEIIRVIDLCGVTPLVRVMKNDPDIIKRSMDIGAHGVLVPLVNSQVDAQKAVEAVKYPPKGIRGVGLARAQKYSMDFKTYYKWNQENSILIVQVEHIKAVENLEEIMSVCGVDGFIIGLYDLSGSLGCPGDFSNPRVKEALKEIHQKSKRFGYLMGQHIVDPKPELVKQKIKEGVKFIGFSDDFLLLNLYAKQLFGKIKSLL
jgi:2-dehydro-3-deoxyglucarate aldolase